MSARIDASLPGWPDRRRRGSWHYQDAIVEGNYAGRAPESRELRIWIRYPAAIVQRLEGSKVVDLSGSYRQRLFLVDFERRQCHIRSGERPKSYFDAALAVALGPVPELRKIAKQQAPVRRDDQYVVEGTGGRLAYDRLGRPLMLESSQVRLTWTWGETTRVPPIPDLAGFGHMRLETHDSVVGDPALPTKLTSLRMKHHLLYRSGDMPAALETSAFGGPLRAVHVTRVPSEFFELGPGRLNLLDGGRGVGIHLVASSSSLHDRAFRDLTSHFAEATTAQGLARELRSDRLGESNDAWRERSFTGLAGEELTRR